MIKLIPYREIARDENGYWLHPEFSSIEKPGSDGEVTEEFLSANHTYSYLLDGEDSPANDNYFEKGSPDISMWDVRPKEGWYLFSINDTDDGPVAHYFKPKTVDELSKNLALEKILTELERATRKFPTWPTDPIHAFSILGEEHGELNKAVLQMCYEPHKTSKEEIETEAIQTAAMALRFLMSIDKYEYQPAQQHTQGSGFIRSLIKRLFGK